MTFYEKVQNLCRKEGFEISNIGEKIGLKISRGAISKWKKGAKPRPGTIKSIADFFGVTVDYLTDETAVDTGIDYDNLDTSDYNIPVWRHFLEMYDYDVKKAYRDYWKFEEAERGDAMRPLDEQLSGIEFALYGEVKELTENQKQDILDYVKFKKSQWDKNNDK